MPRGGCWAVDRPHTMFPFEIERDGEEEMKGNRQNWREEVSIFGSCGLPYLAFFFFFFLPTSQRHSTHKHKHTHGHTNTHSDGQSYIINPFCWATSKRSVCSSSFSITPVINKSCCFVSAIFFDYSAGAVQEDDTNGTNWKSAPNKLTLWYLCISTHLSNFRILGSPERCKIS